MSEYMEPVVSDVNRGFWEGTAAGELRAQRCSRGHLRLPPAPWCPFCLVDESEWVTLSGRAIVLSRLIFHQAYHPAWKDRLPYNVVLVQLEEGPRMISNVTPLSSQDFAVGDALEAVFEPEGDIVIPRFRRVGTPVGDQGFGRDVSPKILD
jgi:uncharacterized OB-fold protein